MITAMSPYSIDVTARLSRGSRHAKTSLPTLAPSRLRRIMAYLMASRKTITLSLSDRKLLGTSSPVRVVDFREDFVPKRIRIRRVSNP